MKSTKLQELLTDDSASVNLHKDAGCSTILIAAADDEDSVSVFSGPLLLFEVASSSRAGLDIVRFCIVEKTPANSLSLSLSLS